MDIREITADNDYGYKQFLMAGLTSHDDCFRISPADEAHEPFPTRGTLHSFTLAAITEDNQLAGVASFKRENDNREKLSHKGLLFRMYVADVFSGQGIGAILIQHIVDRVRQLGDIEQINLTVVAANTRARDLYSRFGFQTFGVEKHSIKSGNTYYDEALMVLFLDSSLRGDGV